MVFTPHQHFPLENVNLSPQCLPQYVSLHRECGPRHLILSFGREIGLEAWLPHPELRDTLTTQLVP